jgi:hypothetical protein
VEGVEVEESWSGEHGYQSKYLWHRVQCHVKKETEGKRRTSSSIRGLVNSNEAMTELKHIVSIRRGQRRYLAKIELQETHLKEMMMN